MCEQQDSHQGHAGAWPHGNLHDHPSALLTQGQSAACERLQLLLDQKSFQEIGSRVASGFPGSGAAQGDSAVVVGYGKIDGRPVGVYADDPMMLLGTFSGTVAAKVEHMLRLTIQSRKPFISVHDSGEARIEGGPGSLDAYAALFQLRTQASGVIPQIAVVVGTCVGGAAYSVGLSDFIVMIEDSSHMSVTSPTIVRLATGEEVDAEHLGGALVHSQVSGVAHCVARNEDEAWFLVRQLLGYLPSSNTEFPPNLMLDDDPGREEPSLDLFLPDDPRESYDMYRIVEAVFDRDSFFELHKDYAKNCIVGFARLNGTVVGAVAQQPLFLAGSLDVDAADKIARFVRFCDGFNIPIITFVDSPGFMPGTQQEYCGIIRRATELVHAYAEASVPKISVIVRKACAGAYVALASKRLGVDVCLAWPSAEIVALGTGAAMGGDNHDKQSDFDMADEDWSQEDLPTSHHKAHTTNAYEAVSMGHVDAVIQPAQTRARLVASLDLLEDKRKNVLRNKQVKVPSIQ